MTYLRSFSLLLLFQLACSSAGSPPSDPSPRVPVAPAAAAAASATPLAPPDPREAKLSAAVSELLERRHLRHHGLDDALSLAAFKRYLDALDSSKMFFLRADADALGAYADQIDDELHDGRLELAHLGAARFQARVAVVQTMVAELLAKPLNLDDQETLETDPKKLSLAASEAELRERWRQRLELEVLGRLADMDERAAAQAKAAKDEAKGKGKAKGKDKDKDKGNGEADAPQRPADVIPATFEEREAKARADLAKRYSARFARLASPAPLDAAATLVNAVTGMFDPHSAYLPPNDQANFDIQITGSLEGIGAVLAEEDHYIKVQSVVPGGASWRQGDLEAGDLIEAVAQEGKEAVDVADMPIDEVVQMIRGKKGTVVTLSVRKGTGETKTISITRDVVVIEDSYARGAVVTPKGIKASYGYIYLPGFYGGQRLGQRGAASDMRRLLVELSKRKVDGVVIDLRGNGGGLLDDAREMTGLLIDKGPVVQTQDGDGEKEVLSDDDAGTAFDGPVVVMVDRFSASASEILAGALQDYHRAVIVGTGTHGKGTVQLLVDLDRMGRANDQPLGVFKLTVQQFFRVSGSSTQWKGVVPDVALPDPVDFLETRENTLDNSLPWSEIAALPHTDWKAAWSAGPLEAASEARQAKSKVFATVKARTELLRKRTKETEVPLQRSAWTALQKSQKDALDALPLDLDKGPTRMTATIVDYDGAAAATARPGGRTDDRAAKWRDSLVRDPWVEEALRVLHDAGAAKAVAR